MKFDLIISNPPYNQSLDLKILKAVYPLGDRICFIHPAGWLYDNKHKNKLFLSSRELVKNKFISYTHIENANDLFGIQNRSDIGISYINKAMIGIQDNIYDIDIHGISTMYLSIKSKILHLASSNNLLHHMQPNIDVTYMFGLPSICNGYRMVGKHTELNQMNPRGLSKYNWRFAFNNNDELINFKNYLKTKIARFCLSIYVFNMDMHRGELAAVPYLDFTKSWTNESVAKELGLTKKELEWCLEWIPNSYPEDYL